MIMFMSQIRKEEQQFLEQEAVLDKVKTFLEYEQCHLVFRDIENDDIYIANKQGDKVNNSHFKIGNYFS